MGFTHQTLQMEATKVKRKTVFDRLQFHQSLMKGEKRSPSNSGAAEKRLASDASFRFLAEAALNQRCPVDNKKYLKRERKDLYGKSPPKQGFIDELDMKRKWTQPVELEPRNVRAFAGIRSPRDRSIEAC